jgi:hypothetical protein
MPWPLSQDYNEAIQNPAQCFADPELRQGEAETNALGLPAPRSGNFADVYAVVTGPRKWAVKCFTRQIPGLQERYQQITLHLQQVKLPFMVDFTFLQRGIRVRGDWFPILKMQWVEGFTLNQFVKTHLDKPKVLDVLCQLWVKLAARLREGNIAHCDLQHGNVLLVPAKTGKTGTLSVKLVDYDGMCVPSLSLLKSIEVGHPAYQHPQRQRDGIYNLQVDRFSHLVIYTALRALMIEGKALWQKHDDGDNLLFRPADYLAPTTSPLFHAVLTSGSEELGKLGQVIVQSLSGPLDQVPLLESLASPRPTTPVKVKTSAEPSAAVAAGIPPLSDFSSVALGGRLSAATRPKRAPSKPPLSKIWMAAGAGVLVLVTIGGLFLAFRGGSKPGAAPILAEKKPARDVDKQQPKEVPLSTQNPEPDMKSAPEPKASPGPAPIAKPKPGRPLESGPIFEYQPKANPIREPPPADDPHKRSPEASVPPLEHKVVRFQYKHDVQPVRAVNLRMVTTPRAGKTSPPTNEAQYLDIEAQETAQQVADRMIYRLEISSCKTWTGAKGLQTPLFPQADGLVGGRSLEFSTTRLGWLVKFDSPNVLEGPQDVREEWDDLLNRIARGYELGFLTIPAEDAQPNINWNTPMPLLGRGAAKPLQSFVFAQCTYLGSRLERGQRQAQVVLRPGTVKDFPSDQPIAGQVSGKMQFALDRGYVTLAEVKLETATETVDVYLTRSDPGENRRPMEPEPKHGPLEPKAVVLRYKFDVQPVRTVKFCTSLHRQAKDEKKPSPAQCLEVEAVETVGPDANGGRNRLRIASAKASLQVNGQKTPLHLESEKLIPGPKAYAFFPVLADGTLREQTTGQLSQSDYSAELCRAFDTLLDRVANGYELTCVPVSANEIRQGGTWDTRFPAMIVHLDNKEVKEIRVRCTYEGSRVQGGQRQAHITLAGTVRQNSGATVIGRFMGKLQFAVESGYLAQADMRVEIGDDTLEVHLIRAAGNLLAIEPFKE